MGSTPEAKVRDPVVKWAKKNGVGHVRMTFRAGVRQGTPDDLFLFPGGVCCWVEFKRPGKVPTELQAHRIQKLREYGFWAVWFSDSAIAIAYLDALLAQAGRRAA